MNQASNNEPSDALSTSLEAKSCRSKSLAYYYAHRDECKKKMRQYYYNNRIQKMTKQREYNRLKSGVTKPREPYTRHLPLPTESL